MIGNRKEEGRVCTVLLHVIRKSPTPSENRLTAIMNFKKTKSDPEFEPGLPRQNASALSAPTLSATTSTTTTTTAFTTINFATTTGSTSETYTRTTAAAITSEILTATTTTSITTAAFASTATIGLQLSNCYSHNIYNSYCHYHFSFPLVPSKEFLFKCLQSAATCLSCLSRVGATQRTESSLDENVFRVIENSDENCCLRRLHRRLEFRNGCSLL